MLRFIGVSVFIHIGCYLGAQEIFLSTLGNVLFRLDLNDCSYQQVGTMPLSTTDITFHPDGNLYAITSTGRLHRIDPLAGTSVLIYTFEQSPSQLYTSLTASATGVFYACGLGGDLWSYDLATGLGFYHGDVGYGAEGDLAFYQGELYMAAVDDNIVRVNIQNPANSVIAIDGNVPGRIFGIITYAASCEELTVYALTNNAASIFQVDFVNNALVPFCNIPLQVSGGASTFEFLGSNPITIDDVQTGGFACGESTGSVQVTATGGVGVLTYSLDGTNFQATGSFNGLPVDSYTVFVTDEVGCTFTQEVVLDEAVPTITQVTVTNNTCGEDNGQLTVAVSGGSPPYQLSVNGVASTTGLTVSNLPTGTYTLRVTDITGCVATTQASLNSAVVPTLDATVAPTTCGEVNGTITLTTQGGLPPLQYSLDQGVAQSAGLFASLPAGTYRAQVADANGCRDSLLLTIASSSAIEVDSVVIVDPSCGFDNGTVRVYARGGQAPLQYDLSGVSNPTGTAFFEGFLAPGDYDLTVRDADGCEVVSSVVLPPSEGMTFADVDIRAATCQQADGQLGIRYNNAVGTVNLQLNNRPQPGSVRVDNLSADTYSLLATDERGCTATLGVFVPASNCPIYLPNAFSPNRDGVNDAFGPQAASGSGIVVLRFQIFDRWGGMVFDRANLPLSASDLAWDGRKMGEPLPQGVYAYAIEVLYEDGQRAVFSGDVLLVL